MPINAADNQPTAGILMPIGGAEDRVRRRVILNRFVQLCGGPNARIAIIPTASNLPDTGGLYHDVFSALGAGTLYCIDVQTRQEANDPELGRVLAGATGIFMTGGDQVRLMSVIGGTEASRAIQFAHRSGAHVAGTSAGASAISQHMVAFGRSGASPALRMVSLAPGLGLTSRLIIDQHFRQRNRLGRLMTAVAMNPEQIGVGVDEDTALLIKPDGLCEVIGAGSVTVVDGTHLLHSNIHEVRQHRHVAVLGAQVHSLIAGYGFDLNTLQPVSPQRTAQAAG